jgi:hypothetical protein
MGLHKEGRSAWTGLIWLKIGLGGEILIIFRGYPRELKNHFMEHFHASIRDKRGQLFMLLCNEVIKIIRSN